MAELSLIPEFQKNKLLKETARNWDLFYKRNTTNFFKDRHWTDREFPELRPSGDVNGPQLKKLLELGCGVGNFLYPLLEINSELFIYCCDLSKRAIDFVKSHPQYDERRCKAFVCDISRPDNITLSEYIPTESLDLVSSLFVLSAIPPSEMSAAVRNIRMMLKPGGVVLFRDYGKNDAAQLRFKPSSRMGEDFYVRQDGTFSFFFSVERIREIFEAEHFETIEAEYIEKTVVNRKQVVAMNRVFVQARFRKKGRP